LYNEVVETYSDPPLALGIREMCNPAIEVGGVRVAKRIELLEQPQDVEHGRGSRL
jgi:hypothetical protein